MNAATIAVTLLAFFTGAGLVALAWAEQMRDWQREKDELARQMREVAEEYLTGAPELGIRHDFHTADLIIEWAERLDGKEAPHG